MKWFLFLFGIFCSFAAPLLATDVDFYLGLDWVQPEPDQEIHLLAVYPSELPKDMESYRILAPKENPTTRHGALLSHVILRCVMPLMIVRWTCDDRVHEAIWQRGQYLIRIAAIDVIAWHRHARSTDLLSLFLVEP